MSLQRGRYPRSFPRVAEGGITIGYVIDSETIGSRSVIVIDQDSIEGFGYDLSYTRTVKLSPAVANILELVQQRDGIVVRDRQQPITPELNSAIAVINPRSLDPFYADTLTVIVLPPRINIDPSGNISTTGDYTPEEALRANAGVFDTRDKKIVNPDTQRRIHDPKHIMQILRRYHINGYTDPLGATVERSIVKIQYKGFANNIGEGNCLERALTDKYHTAASKSDAIATSAIKKIVGDSPTYENFEKFATKYKIKYALHDIGGAFLVKNSYEANTKKRRTFVGILYNNHIYPYDGRADHVRFEPSYDTDIPEYLDQRIPNNVDERLESAYNMMMKTSKLPNFSYKAESNVVMVALSWYEPTKRKPEKLYTCYDMKRAYRNIIMNISDKNEQLPIFSACDIIEPYGGQPIEAHNYYWLREDFDYDKSPILSARSNNLLHGFEVQYLITNKLAAINDITHVKSASYFMPLEAFRDGITQYEATNEFDEKSYPLYNGLLGKVWSMDKSMMFSGVSEIDAELLQAVRSPEDISVREDGDGTLAVNMRVAKGRYSNINSRNLYNYTVARTNLAVSQFIIETLEINKHAKLVKIKCDGVVFDHPVTLPKKWCEYYRIDPVVWLPIRHRIAQMYPDIIRAESIEELSSINTQILIGSPGTGKTYTVKEQNEHDVALTVSNACSRVMDTERVRGVTLFSQLHLHTPEDISKVISAHANKTIWLDEFSMYQKYIWSFIVAVGYGAKKLIISGDSNQSPPVGEKHDYNSTFFATLFKTATRLTKDYRNDEGLIALRDVIIGDSTVQQRVDAMFRQTQIVDPASVNTHLTKLHKTRIAINSYIVQARGLVWSQRRDAGLLDKESKQTYSYTASRGLILVASSTAKLKKIYKGMRYTLECDVTEESDSFTVTPLNAADSIPLDVADMKYFDLGYAMTIESTQGLTIPDGVCIWNISRLLSESSKNILYTAITRECALDRVQINWGDTHALFSKYPALPTVPGCTDEYTYEMKFTATHKPKYDNSIYSAPITSDIIAPITSNIIAPRAKREPLTVVRQPPPIKRRLVSKSSLPFKYIKVTEGKDPAQCVLAVYQTYDLDYMHLIWDKKLYTYTVHDNIRDIDVTGDKHEVRRGGAMKLVIDVDGDESLDAFDIVREMREAVCTAFWAVYPGTFMDSEYLYAYESNGDTKRSYHFALQMYQFDNHNEAKQFMYEVIDRLPPTIGNAVDMQIYRSNMSLRLLGATKDGRTKRPIGNTPNDLYAPDDLYASMIYTDGAEQMLPLLCNYVDAEERQKHSVDIEQILSRPDVVSIVGCAHEFREVTDDGLMIFRRLEPSYCTICARVHETDNTLMLRPVGDTVKQLCRHAGK